MKLLNHIGKSRGAKKSKHNRAQKLVDGWNELKTKMEHFVSEGHGISQRARCAYGVLLIMETGIRVGNENSAEGYTTKPHPKSKVAPKFLQTYGLTTLNKSHVKIEKKSMTLHFTGKKGVEQTLNIYNPTLIKHASTLLAQNKDTFLDIGYRELRRFIQKSVGSKFTAKDFRTAYANKLFAKVFEIAYAKKPSPITKKKEANAILKMTIETTAQIVGHTKGVCKSAYVSSGLFTLVQNKLYAEVERNKEKAKKSKKTKKNS